MLYQLSSIRRPACLQSTVGLQTPIRALASALALICATTAYGDGFDAFTEPTEIRSCRQVQLEKSLEWLTTVTYLPETGELLLTDPSRKGERKALAFSLDGILKREVQAANLPAVLLTTYDKEGQPHRFASSGWTLVPISHDLRKTGDAIDLRKNRPGAELEMGTPFERLIAGDQLFAFGPLVRTDSKDRAGHTSFYVRELRPDEKDRILPEPHEVQPFYGDDLYYRVGHQLITAQGTHVYFLSMEKTAKLYHYDLAQPHGARQHSASEIKSFPWRDREMPVFQNSPADRVGKTPGANRQGIFQQVESFDEVPVGLYSSDGLIYVLIRQPHEDGGTSWRMERYLADGASLQPLDPIFLPTRAAHLSLLPTRQGFWAVAERGKVNADGKQDVSTVLLLPNSWLKDSARSPLLNPLARSITCQPNA